MEYLKLLFKQKNKVSIFIKIKKEKTLMYIMGLVIHYTKMGNIQVTLKQ